MGVNDETEGTLWRGEPKQITYIVCLHLAFDPCCMITSVSQLSSYSLLSPVEQNYMCVF